MALLARLKGWLRLLCQSIHTIGFFLSTDNLRLQFNRSKTVQQPIHKCRGLTWTVVKVFGHGEDRRLLAHVKATLLVSLGKHAKEHSLVAWSKVK